MNKYSNSKIYKIISNKEPKYYYIGSTITELNVRLNRHKANSKMSPNTKIYKYFIDIEWDVTIQLIEEVNITNSKELHIIENNYIKQALDDNLCLNTYHSILNKQLRKQKIIEYGKQYYNENIEEIRKKQNEYYFKTKDYKHQKYEENKDTINKRKQEKIICDCGINSIKNNFARHLKSKHHINFLQNKT